MSDTYQLSYRNFKTQKSDLKRIKWSWHALHIYSATAQFKNTPFKKASI